MALLIDSAVPEDTEQQKMDFILALNSKLISIFNHSRDITPCLHTHTTPLFQVELENTVEGRWTCFGVRVLRTLNYPTVKLNPR